MTTTTALLALILTLLAALLGGALFSLVHSRPSLAVPVTVALAGMTLVVTCAVGIIAR
ncbi:MULTISPECIES: hypothetical protein [Streptomyces]|uniref:Histidine kinase n=1 Tax=Streptomyces glycanivorans TaxID=3033808 RepID=A0ABY9JEY0_9ACTN|nr:MULTISPECIES: hypothetical protein [unclassified Streptomyces]WSQ78611.1 hypothetical protein OG725_16515 [Streptomyces sp. NBC_01213]WLQ65231.1 hypothetical protein P8A20_17260 [Streptomyces sp. Alt3]WSQ86005.1 hypothetical protein OG722_17280 [Streptomyces sp. NBC_01212]WSR07919.1 hypothetical protein OG265_18805 [Streptomyces sp. NBC_01208]WSR49348.1 hypothetical protein OG279_17675 [Streptomyces sp. NBC_01201]